MPERIFAKRVDDVYRAESRRVFARLFGCWAILTWPRKPRMHAFAAAVEQCRNRDAGESAGLAVSAGRFRAIDATRRRARFDSSKLELATRFNEAAETNAAREWDDIRTTGSADLHLLSPGICAGAVQVAMTLREVCDLTTEENCQRVPDWRRPPLPSGLCGGRRRFVTRGFRMWCRRCRSAGTD